MAKPDFLKERAAKFFDAADYHRKMGHNSLTAFNLEQAVQLYLKYYLFLRLGDYPKMHSIEELLEILRKAYRETETIIARILRDDASTIGDLEQAYITSRYMGIKFSKNRIEKMRQFSEKLMAFLSTLDEL